MQIQYPFITRLLAEEEGGGYLIAFPDLPGCMADGETIEDAITQAQDALEAYIKSCIANGDPVPPPSNPQNFSGQWRVRVPKSLHAALVMKAKQEGVSLNMLTATLLAEGINKEIVCKPKNLVKKQMVPKRKIIKSGIKLKPPAVVKKAIKKKASAK